MLEFFNANITDTRSQSHCNIFTGKFNQIHFFCLSVFIVNFEHVFACWESHQRKRFNNELIEQKLNFMAILMMNRPNLPQGFIAS